MIHRHYQSKQTSVIVTIYRNEVIYDVDFTSNRVARTRFNEEDMKKASLITSESDAADYKDDYIDRLITSALTKVSQKLAFARPQYNVAPIPVAPPNDISVNNDIHPDQAYTIKLAFEDGWCGAPQNICNFIHSYIVNSVLAEWFLITLPDLAPIYQQEASANLRSLVHEGRSVILSGVQGFYL